MTRETLTADVDRIIALSRDDEVAHSEEDRLHRSLIDQFCPQWVVAEVERLTNADFARWCA